MKEVKVTDILNELFASIDDGSAFKDKKKKKVTVEPIKQAQPRAFKFHKPSLEPVAIVVLYTDTVCNSCGNHSHSTGKHALVEKVDKHNNKHYTRFMTSSNINELPRRKMFLQESINVCYRCFEDAELTPVCDDDALKSIQCEAEVTRDSEVKDGVPAIRNVEEQDDMDLDEMFAEIAHELAEA